jgi:hypothetical protein
MHGPPVAVELADEDARPLPARWVVFDHDGTSDMLEHLTSKDTVRGHLVVAVSGDPHVAVLDQADNKPERLAHVAMSPSGRSESGFTQPRWANAHDDLRWLSNAKPASGRSCYSAALLPKRDQHR